VAANIDKRVVEMEFNNKDFEKGAKESLETLNNLEKGLKLKNAGRGLQNLARVAGGFSLMGIDKGISAISNRFSAFGIAGMTIIQNLTNAAINMGKRIFNSMTGMDAIKGGLVEYETQMNSVQTIMANTSKEGTTLDTVISALDELNEYADLTIYNFAEMTRNIGTFTAAGVELDTSVDAIKGIANLAAVSGSSSQQANTAMYQISQALSSGTVRLMDWRSIENAGMGGALFKDSLMETARVHDIAIDKIIEKEGSFRDSLSTGWLSKDILLETLQKYTGDLSAEQLAEIGYTQEQIKEIQKLGDMANDAATKVKTFTQLKETLQEAAGSGWAKSWQIVAGDFEEAKEMWTAVSDSLGYFIEKSSSARNELLQGWKDLGGRDALLETIGYGFKQLVKLIEPVKDALHEFFPALTAEKLFEFSDGLRSIVMGSFLSRKSLDKVNRVFRGVFATADILKDGVVTLAKGFWSLIGATGVLDVNFLDILASGGDWLVNLRDTIKENKVFEKILTKIETVILNVKNGIIAFGRALGYAYEFAKQFFSDIKPNFDEFKQKVFDSFGPAKEKIQSFFEDIKNVDTSGITLWFDKIKERLSFENLKATIGPVMTKIKDFLVEKINDIFTIEEGELDFLDKITEVYTKIMEYILEKAENLEFSEVLDALSVGFMGALIVGLKNFVELDPIESVKGIFDTVQDTVKNIGGSIDGVLGTLKTNLEGMQKSVKAEVIKKIAIAVAILALSAIALSLIDSTKLAVSMGAITVMFADLMASVAIFDKMEGKGGSKKIATMMAVMIGVAVAVLIMSVAMKSLAELDWDELARGSAGILALTTILVIAAKMMDKNSGSLLKASLGIVAFSFGLLIVGFAVAKLAKMNGGELEQGMLAVAILIGVFSIFAKMASDTSGLIKAAIAMGILAVALIITSFAVERFGQMDGEQLQKGLLTIAGIFAVLAIFTKVVGDGSGVIKAALAMVILAGAVYLLSFSMSAMGDLSWDQLARGLVGMGVGLGLLVAAMHLVPKDILMKAAGLAVAAFAVMILANAIGTMGAMSWEEAGKGLLVMAGALAILSVALYSMSAALPGAAALLVASAALMMLAPAMVMLGGLSLAAIGTGLLALAGALAVIGLAGVVLAPVVPVILLLSGAMLLFGLAILAIGAGVAIFAAGLTALAAAGTAGVAVLALIIQAFIALLPMIVEGLSIAFDLLLEMITSKAVAVTESFTVIFLAVLTAINNVLPALGETFLLIITVLTSTLMAGTPLIVAAALGMLLAILTGIRDNIYEITTVAYEVVEEFLSAIAEKSPDLATQAFDTLIAFVDGLALAVEEKLPELIDAGANLASAVIDGLIEGLGGDAYTGLVEKIRSIAIGAWDAFKAALGIESPSKAFYESGIDIIQGVTNALTDGSGDIESSAESVANAALDTMTSIVNEVASAMDSEMEYNPTITPVMDITEAAAKAKELTRAIEGTTTLNLSAEASSSNIGSAEVVSNGQNGSESSDGAEGTIVFNQTNNSPKALNRFELYQMTQRQLAMFRMVKG
jgi:hypothetical protein